MDINVILFDGFTALDFVGPAEVLHRIPEFQIRYYSVKGGLVSNGNNLTVETERLEYMQNGILLVPGGWGTRTAVDDNEFIAALKEKCLEAEYCLAVCTGSALYAKTGLLDGRKATSNKKAMDWVRDVAPCVDWQYKARWVVDGKYYTSSGVSAGIDMALGFVSDRYGKEKALEIAGTMEYIWNEDATVDLFATKHLQ